MRRLEGKVALITGAARGTGEVTSQLFVEAGARVVVADVRDAQGQAVAKELGESALYVHLDVTDESGWESAMRATLEAFGSLNVLVNNAGVLHMEALVDTSLEDFERVIRVNQIGTFLGLRAAVEPMKRAGGGSIVNISSIDGLQGRNGLVAYCASKWAVRGMTRAAALELGRFGIRVNAVCPEAGSGDMMAPYIPEGLDIEKIAAHGQPYLATQKSRSIRERMEDVARMVQFLASEESASCTGADFAVDGGNLAGRVIRGTPGA